MFMRANMNICKNSTREWVMLLAENLKKALSASIASDRSNEHLAMQKPL